MKHLIFLIGEKDSNDINKIIRTYLTYQVKASLISDNLMEEVSIKIKALAARTKYVKFCSFSWSNHQIFG